MNKAKLEKILNTPMESNDAGAGTIKDYLMILLEIMWEDEDSKPFGNSSWKYEVYDALVRAGMIDGKLVTEKYNDEEFTYVDECDTDAGHRLIMEVIKKL